MALLGTWLGGILAFGVAFVPAVFGNLPTPQAAQVLGEGFSGLDRAGMLLAGGAVLLGVYLNRRRGGDWLTWLGTLLPLAGVLAHALGWFWVSPELRELRVAAGGTIGALAVGDPGWERFESLHWLSQTLFWTAAFAALGSVALSLRVRSGPSFSADDVENA